MLVSVCYSCDSLMTFPRITLPLGLSQLTQTPVSHHQEPDKWLRKCKVVYWQFQILRILRKYFWTLNRSDFPELEKMFQQLWQSSGAQTEGRCYKRADLTVKSVSNSSPVWGEEKNCHTSEHECNGHFGDSYVEGLKLRQQNTLRTNYMHASLMNNLL